VLGMLRDAPGQFFHMPDGLAFSQDCE